MIQQDRNKIFFVFIIHVCYTVLSILIHWDNYLTSVVVSSAVSLLLRHFKFYTWEVTRTKKNFTKTLLVITRVTAHASSLWEMKSHWCSWNRTHDKSQTRFSYSKQSIMQRNLKLLQYYITPLVNKVWIKLISQIFWLLPINLINQHK